MRYLLRFLKITAPAIVAGALSGYVSAALTLTRAMNATRAFAARQLTLVDEAGRIGAQLSWEQAQPSLKLFDRANHVRCALFLEPNGTPDLYLYDDHEKARAALNLFDSGVPNLAFSDAAGNLMWTDFDNNRSYNTKFMINNENNGRLIVRHGMTAGPSGIHVSDDLQEK